MDDADYEMLNAHKWCAWQHGQTFYATRAANTIHMHRVIMGAKGVDHVNGDGLDNRRTNLRRATHQQQAMNTRKRAGCTSQFKGIHRSGRKWVALIKTAGRQMRLGSFDNEEDAARAYDAAAREHFGEFARVNFAA